MVLMMHDDDDDDDDDDDGDDGDTCWWCMTLYNHDTWRCTMMHDDNTWWWYTLMMHNYDAWRMGHQRIQLKSNGSSLEVFPGGRGTFRHMHARQELLLKLENMVISCVMISHKNLPRTSDVCSTVGGLLNSSLFHDMKWRCLSSTTMPTRKHAL